MGVVGLYARQGGACPWWARLLARGALVLSALAALTSHAQTPPGTVITNVAQASWTIGGTPAGASTQVQFAVVPYSFGTDLSVAKYGPAQVLPGGAITWRLLVSNNGPGAASAVQVLDNVPAGVTAISAQCRILTSGTCGAVNVGATGGPGTPVTVTLASLPVGGRAEITVQGTAPAIAGNISNQAQVSVAGTLDPAPANNVANSTTQVTPAATANASLRGSVWQDNNQNRVRDPGEPPYAGFRVLVYDAAGTTVVTQTTTDALGSYAFTGLASGASYQVEFRDPTGNQVFALPVSAEGGGAGFAMTMSCSQTATTMPPSVNSPVGAGTCYCVTNAGSISQVMSSGRIQVTLQPGDNLFEQSLPLDPSGVIYDSVTRQPIAGATVSLSGPAGFDPAIHLVGGAASANQVTGPSGFYRFLLIGGAPAGRYTIAVAPPAGYAFPSVLLPASPPLDPTGLGTAGIYPVQAQVTPPTGANPTTYHLAFDLAVGDPDVVNNHIPLDPSGPAGQLLLRKTASKTIVALGDFLQYRLDLTNSGAAAVNAVSVSDRLPVGFRLRSGSARVREAAVPDPVVSADGRTLSFALGTLAAGATLDIRYVVEVTAGAPRGQAMNSAQALGTGAASLVARATVTVQEDLFRSRAVLLGRVIEVERCDARTELGKGVAGVRVFLENGATMLTDKEGKWHVDGVRPGTHVVQLDLDSLPEGYEPMVCEQNARLAGRSFSQFVNVQGGTLWRADFYVRKAGAVAFERKVGGALSLKLSDSLTLKTPPESERVEAPRARDENANIYAPGAAQFDASWLASAAPELDLVYPPEGFAPGVGATKVLVKHDATHAITLSVNGAPVHALNFDGRELNAAKSVGLSRWGGVPLREGDNRLVAVAQDAQGREVGRVERIVHFSSSAAEARLAPAASVLVADGRTVPEIAVRILDREGNPARPGTFGTVTLSAPYQSLEVQQARDARPLLDDFGNQPRWRVGADGLARIRLQPTTASGEVVLTFNFQNQAPQLIRAWLTPKLRDWILVGFGEGTLSSRSLSGNMEALEAQEPDERLYKDGQVAFYAKGRIKGDYLLTLAYDSAKERLRAGGTGGDRFGQTIDPKQYYTLYGDAMSPQYDAASVRKLYVRLEKNQFYALFGDFTTGLTVTELSRYSRTLNGVKSEFRGEELGYTAFATRTAQAFVRDELRGDGTSGAYRLSRVDLLPNSEKVTIETRDRFRSELLLKSEPQSRGVDYDVDYALGTLFFRRALPNKDQNFNPIYIIVEYEAEDRQRDERTTAGGRVYHRLLGGRAEIGLSGVHEGNTGARGELAGADVSVQLSDKTRVKAELAGSKRDFAGTRAEGDAYLAELQHRDNNVVAKAYVRSQDPGFGVGQQRASETGTQKIGGDVSLKLSPSLTLNSQAYREQIETSAATAQRNLVEARVNYTADDHALYAGGRSVHDRAASGESLNAEQIVAGASRRLMDGRLNARADVELSVGGNNESVDFPHRLRAGGDYRVSERVSLFAEQELTYGAREDTSTTRFGAKASPWEGAQSASSLNFEQRPEGPTLSNSSSLTQNVRLSDKISLNAGIDRTSTIRKPGNVPLNPNAPSAQGLGSLLPVLTPARIEDYTALFVGAAWNDGPWGATARAEFRDGETQKRTNLSATLHRDLSEGEAVAASLLYSSDTGNAAGDSKRIDARLNYVWRPVSSRWILLDRLDFISENTSNLSSGVRSRRLVNNLNANHQFNRRTQLALQYGAKYVFETFDGYGVRGYTDLMGAELRHDLGARFDLGVRAGMLHSWGAQTYAASYGLSLGYSPMTNLWVGLGYNFRGFRDNDFSGAAYTAKGLYLAFRFKFDQGEKDVPTRRRAMFDEASR